MPLFHSNISERLEDAQIYRICVVSIFYTVMSIFGRLFACAKTGLRLQSFSRSCIIGGRFFRSCSTTAAYRKTNGKKDIRLCPSAMSKHCHPCQCLDVSLRAANSLLWQDVSGSMQYRVTSIYNIHVVNWLASFAKAKHRFCLIRPPYMAVLNKTRSNQMYMDVHLVAMASLAVLNTYLRVHGSTTSFSNEKLATAWN